MYNIICGKNLNDIKKFLMITLTEYYTSIIALKKISLVQIEKTQFAFKLHEYVERI